MLLMRPDLANVTDLEWMQGSSDEDTLLRAVLEVAALHPGSNPAALLHELQQRIDENQLRALQRELHILDENLDFALEFEGARKQIRDMYAQQGRDRLLDRVKEKSLSELTVEERELLKSVRSR
jgi:DNA primase